MHDLTITPQGHLLVRDTPDASDRKLSKALLEAYGESPARGMLVSASEEIDTVLPASFEFARSIARSISRTSAGWLPRRLAPRFLKRRRR